MRDRNGSQKEFAIYVKSITSLSRIPSKSSTFAKEKKKSEQIDNMGFFDFLNSNNHVVAKIDSSGKLYDRNNHVLGRITWTGDVQDANNHTLGHISRSGEVRSRWYSKLGEVQSNGEVRDSNGHLLGSIDSWGTVKDKNNHTIGHASGVPRHQAAVFFFFEF